MLRQRLLFIGDCAFLYNLNEAVACSSVHMFYMAFAVVFEGLDHVLVDTNIHSNG